MRTLAASVAPDRDRQRRGSPPERLVGKASDHGVPHNALAAAPTAPLVRLEDSAGEHGPLRFEALAGHLESELVETAEGGQISACEPSIRARRDGSVGHVEVFQMSV